MPDQDQPKRKKQSKREILDDWRFEEWDLGLECPEKVAETISDFVEELLERRYNRSAIMKAAGLGIVEEVRRYNYAKLSAQGIEVRATEADSLLVRIPWRDIYTMEASEADMEVVISILQRRLKGKRAYNAEQEADERRWQEREAKRKAAETDGRFDEPIGVWPDDLVPIQMPPDPS